MRRWLPRLHLSTAIVLFLAASGLVALNMNVEPPLGLVNHTRRALYGNHFVKVLRRKDLGWPVTAVVLLEEYEVFEEPRWKFNDYQILHGELALDFAAALAILVSIWLLLEWKIARKPNQIV